MTQVKVLFELFNDGSIVFAVFLVALVVIGVFSKNSSARELLVFPSLLVMLGVFSPAIIEKAKKYFAITRVVRLYWLFPITIVLAYICVKILERYCKKGIEYIVVMVLLSGCIMGIGKCVFGSENFSSAENIYKIPNDTIAVCEAIKADGYEGVLVPSIELVDTIRQYDAHIQLAYRGNSHNNYIEIGEVLNRQLIEVELLEDYFGTEDYVYLLINKEREIDGELADKGFDLLLETENHWLYKYKKEH